MISAAGAGLGKKLLSPSTCLNVPTQTALTRAATHACLWAGVVAAKIALTLRQGNRKLSAWLEKELDNGSALPLSLQSKG